MMKNNLRYLIGTLAVLMILVSCKKTNYSMGDLVNPTNIVFTTEVVGQDAANPNGDGSGDVVIHVTADNAIGFKVDYDAATGVNLVYLPKGGITHKYTTLGTHTYRITVVVYGPGGTSSTLDKEVTVLSTFEPPAEMVTAITGDASKTWRVQKEVPGHFGVGPWDPNSVRPEWYAAAPNEKAACCPCFYSATFTFTKISGPTNTYTLQVASPEGAFTKTGSLTTLPGIPGSGDEGCYSYGGGTSAVSFAPASSGAALEPDADHPLNSKSTGVSMLLDGVTTYIGYGALLKEYEILTYDDTVTPNLMYLRVQGTETGNAWYLKLIAE